MPVTLSDANGKIISTSPNFNFVNRLARKKNIKYVSVDSQGDMEIVFNSGLLCAADFPDVESAKYFIRRWKRIYGVNIFISGEFVGVADFSNKNLRTSYVKRSKIELEKMAKTLTSNLEPGFGRSVSQFTVGVDKTVLPP